jgi:hypothetical protein
MELKDFLPFGAGVVTTFLGFGLNQLWVHHRERKFRFQKIISLLKAAHAEVEFNHGKLIRLKQDLSNCLNVLKIQKTFWGVPSYDILPNFLEKLKGELVAYPETSALVKTVGNLHFEAAHIQHKVDFLSDQILKTEVDDARSNSWQWAMITNIESTLGLIELNIKAFHVGPEEISETLATLERNYFSFVQTSPFFLWLNEGDQK